MNPNSPNQQQMPGGMPVNVGQAQPGMPYVPQHGLAETAGNIQTAMPVNAMGTMPSPQMPPAAAQAPVPQPGMAMPSQPPMPPMGGGTPQATVSAPMGSAAPNGQKNPGVQRAINPNSTQN